VDVSDPVSVDALARQAIETFGTVHVVCNNAGIGPPAPVADLTPRRPAAYERPDFTALPLAGKPVTISNMRPAGGRARPVAFGTGY
jgi:NAD(P)-dependent dehydrogenase (short-subunit alcohol dehydrogenase family)